MTQGGQASYSPPPEMVQEMKVQTAPFDASLGGFSGANFNMVTRSGSNGWHGDLWFSHYSRPLMTRNFFVNRFIFDPATGPITDEKKNRSGRPPRPTAIAPRFSGPVIKNKTFFVYGYDKLFRKRPQTGTNTVPTVPQRERRFQRAARPGQPLPDLRPGYHCHRRQWPVLAAAAPEQRDPGQPHRSRGQAPARLLPAAELHRERRRPHQLHRSHRHPSRLLLALRARRSHLQRETSRVRIVLLVGPRRPAGRRFPGIIAIGHVQYRRHRGISLDDVYIISPQTVLNVRYGLTRF